MKQKLAFILFLSIFLGLYSASFAQKKSAQPPKSGGSYQLFFEKVYLTTDRDYYAAGEDIWFKGYLVNAISNRFTYSSNNLYVDLISPESKIIDREILRLDSGMTIGDFKLTDSIPEGTYHLKAYTNWMRNFGDNFIFDKTITVHSVLGIKAQAAAEIKAKQNRKAVVAVAKVPDVYKVSFFPEGGSMVTGIPGIVGFKAEDAIGNGVKVTGSVVSSKGDTVGYFNSTDVGLGSFSLLPDSATRYSVAGTYVNSKIPFKIDLPSVLPDGYAIHIKNTDSDFVQVYISANQACLQKNKGKTLTLIVKHASLTYYKASFSLNDLQSLINIPKAGLPAGVASIVLLDDQAHPNCERLVYIENKNHIKLSVVTDKPEYASKEKTTVTITATDDKNQPVTAQLSLAAVDGSVVPLGEMNIQSYLWLQSEIRGKIENAAMYFDPKNPNRAKQLDLLLLTQGWRDFVWKHLADTALKVSYVPESGFTISGRLRSLFINKPIANGHITLYAPGAKGNKFYIATTDSVGKYYLDGIELYGNQTLKLKSSDEKGKKTGWLFLDSLANNPLAVPKLPIYDIQPTPALVAFNKASTLRMNEENKLKFGNVIQLRQVNIVEKPKTVTLLNETLQTFGYPEYDYTISAADAKTYKDLEDFLMHKVPGATTSTDGNNGIFFFYGGQKINPRFIVDQREDTFDRIDYYSLPMDQVITVAVQHLVTNGGGDRFLIRLTLKPSAYDKKDFSLVNQDVIGYYSARTFYAPNYEYSSSKADERTTIHWEPSITTDATGQATVTFYNADPKSKIRLVTEGLTDKGVPLNVVTWYTVK